MRNMKKIVLIINRRYSLLMSGLDIPEPEARRLAKEYFLKEHPVPTVETVAEEVVLQL